MTKQVEREEAIQNTIFDATGRPVVPPPLVQLAECGKIGINPLSRNQLPLHQVETYTEKNLPKIQILAKK